MFDWNYWLELFEARARNLVIRRPPPEDRLSNAERVRIGNSLGTFQLGEQSEGRTLQSFAERFAARRGIAELPAVTALFIKEEQHHAAQLAEFMRANAIPLKRRNWTDSVFRRIRKLAGYEAAVTILVTAEMIGFVYYRALARATDSPCLRSICRQMCADEAIHLRYETQLLMTLRGERAPLARRCVEFLHRALLSVSARVVFHDHRRVLRYVGYTPHTFRKDCEAIYRMVMSHHARRPRTRGPAEKLAA
ncbi:MAG TPA: hypothetical protein VFV88_12070 [Steroidobacteraceae bacterium]|jgi:hypothetical protein|nr:hypothetical protein [Steroidobacteraceae bacterium]